MCGKGGDAQQGYGGGRARDPGFNGHGWCCVVSGCTVLLHSGVCLLLHVLHVFLYLITMHGVALSAVALSSSVLALLAVALSSPSLMWPCPRPVLSLIQIAKADHNLTAVEAAWEVYASAPQVSLVCLLCACSHVCVT